MVMRGTNRKTVGTEASRMGIDGPWITKSYMEMIMERKGVPRLSTPPLVSNTIVAGSQETTIIAPKPIRINPNVVTGLEDLPQPWTRSPSKSKMEPVVATWHFISSDSSQPDNSVLVIMGSACCVAAKDPNLPNRTRGESLRRDVVYSPSWSFQWDSRERVTGEIENPSYHTSHLDNRNVSMELKGSLSSERGNLSDGGSIMENLVTPISLKSPVDEVLVANLMTPSFDGIVEEAWFDSVGLFDSECDDDY